MVEKKSALMQYAEKIEEEERSKNLLSAISKAFSNPNKLRNIVGKDKLFEEILEFSSEFSAQTWGIVQRNKELQKELKKELEERGIRKISFVGNGQEAIVFSTTQGQMLRISHSRSAEPHKPDTAGVVPVLDSFSLEVRDKIFRKQFLHIQITPEITMAKDKESLTKKELAAARKTITNAGLADGIIISDLKGSDNIGFYDNGEPVSPDLGAALKISIIGKIVTTVKNAISNIISPENNPQMANERLKKARDEHLEGRGLEIGSVKGTFPQGEIDELRKTRGDSNQASRIMEEVIEKQGMYKSDMAELLATAYGEGISKKDFKDIISAKEKEGVPTQKTTTNTGSMDHLEQYISSQGKNSHRR